MSTAEHPTNVSLDEALRIVAARAAEHRMPAECVAVAAADGRVLAEDIHAAHALPPFRNSAMDGFALRGAELPTTGERAFRLIGEVFAGADSAPPVGVGECVRITTGAPLPEGADTVVMKEHVALAGGRVVVRAGERAGSHVRLAGEDYAAGDLAFAAGTRLGAAQLAVVATLGIAEAPVRRRPRVAIFPTGNELVPPGTPLGFGKIHASNGLMLAALARAAGGEVVLQRCVRDDPAALRASLLEAAATADLIATSGGVSVGEADHMPRVLGALGEIHFHHVALQPGGPTIFGEIGACPVLGLPGNPVATAVAFRVLGGFALRAMLGLATLPAPGHARLAAPLHRRRNSLELARCVVHTDDAGVQWATLHTKQGSGMLRGIAEADRLALLPEGVHDFAKGDVVLLWPE